ncbi:hypothetical protein HYALB_00012258 [Hymenoscyphus albidus]|uniref:Uncharacterized protein n=1 Tax=Hymenoscyphus albidus TaxID=595503 RepID=A0A9N9Q438_9HELO|nr:hypothetical protein HYALB_00012258 [Hymenoscyphus albidus]
MYTDSEEINVVIWEARFSNNLRKKKGYFWETLPRNTGLTNNSQDNWIKNMNNAISLGIALRTPGGKGSFIDFLLSNDISFRLALRASGGEWSLIDLMASHDISRRATGQDL